MLDSLQALRALAAAGVVLEHSDYFDRGAFGVDIFFVISGFIMCHVTANEDRGFLVKRLIRVVPLYWVATVLTFGLALHFPSVFHTSGDSLAVLLKSLFFVPYMNDEGRAYPVLSLGWTLNCEMFFYLLFAAALRLNRRRAPLLVCASLLALVFGGHVSTPSSVTGRFYTDPILLEFCYGIAVFHAWPVVRTVTAKVRWPILLSAAASVLVLMAAMLVQDSAFRFFLWGVPAMALVLLGLSLEGRIPVPRTVVALGDASYSLYLFHPYVQKAVRGVLGPLGGSMAGTLLAMLIYVALAMAFAILLYRCFERPAIDYLRARLLSKRPSAPVLTPEPSAVGQA